MRGRKAKPTNLRLIGGNAGKRPLPKREPKPTGDLVKAPNWFTNNQKEIWNCAVKNAPRGLLKRIDESVMIVGRCRARCTSKLWRS
jgi:hypothetical protein